MKIGLFLAYRPNTQFTNQGLGRLMSELLRGFSQHSGDSVTVICPSWLAQDIRKLASRLPDGAIRVVSPPSVPVIIRIHNALAATRSKSRKGPLKNALHKAKKALLNGAITAFNATFAVLSTRSLLVFLITSLFLTAIAAFTSAFIVPIILTILLFAAIFYVSLRLGARLGLTRRIRLLKGIILNRSRRFIGSRPSPIIAIYNAVHRKELSSMLSIIEDNEDVDIWFSPTVFWPEFNKIRKPTVQCFPDMVLSEFPTGFAFGSNADRVDSVYNQVVSAIQSGNKFITYSDFTAKSSLNARFGVSLDDITVIPHAAMDMMKHIRIQGTPDAEVATDSFARTQLAEFQLTRWRSDRYLYNFDFADCEYIFYASQFRPNKNILNLIRAYEIVLRKNFRQCKMILTGNLDDSPEARNLIVERRLQYDILLAHDVSDQMLSALYRSAALAVNPTLYEGGFPFTFTEAMSVGTPVVMSRIPQTQEFIQGDLAGKMLFDPLSPEEIAERIVFGLSHRRYLYELQLPLYKSLRERTWRDVAREHVIAFEKIIADYNSRPA